MYSDVVNPEEFAKYTTGANPHNMHPFVLHDDEFILCVVLASNLQDALDAAADNNKLDIYLIVEEDYDNYGLHKDDPFCTFLGNAGEPFDIESISCEEIPMPSFSLCGLLN